MNTPFNGGTIIISRCEKTYPISPPSLGQSQLNYPIRFLPISTPPYSLSVAQNAANGDNLALFLKSPPSRAGI